MSDDALFQLGMGSVRLNATQTEDHSSSRPNGASDIAFHSGEASAHSFARIGMLRLFRRSRGNSAKALIGPA
jgi:hypothetical protein